MFHRRSLSIPFSYQLASNLTDETQSEIKKIQIPKYYMGKLNSKYTDSDRKTLKTSGKYLANQIKQNKEKKHEGLSRDSHMREQIKSSEL